MLQLFYVDRVVHYKRTVEHIFLLLKGWIMDALRAIKNDGFGRGYVDKRFNIAAMHAARWEPLGQQEGNFVRAGEGSSKDVAME